VILSLGFGAFLVTTLVLVQSNLLQQFNVKVDQSNANLVFFDIQEDQFLPVDSLVRAQGKVLQTAPVVTMRIASINNRTVEQIIGDARAKEMSDSLDRARRGLKPLTREKEELSSATPEMVSRVVHQQDGRVGL
jgi:Predicted ABC-type transport system involved in lysophospholipase L1 biosynthesis, permease component